MYTNMGGLLAPVLGQYSIKKDANIISSTYLYMYILSQVDRYICLYLANYPPILLNIVNLCLFINKKCISSSSQVYNKHSRDLYELCLSLYPLSLYIGRLLIQNGATLFFSDSYYYDKNVLRKLLKNTYNILYTGSLQLSQSSFQVCEIVIASTF